MASFSTQTNNSAGLLHPKHPLTLAMVASFLPSIDISTYTTASSGLDPKALSYFGSVHAVLNSSSIDQAFPYLQQTIGLFETSFDVTSLDDIQDIVSLLDSGAVRVFATQKQAERLAGVDNVDQGRVVLVVGETESAANVEKLCTSEKSSLLFSKSEQFKDVHGALQKRTSSHGPDVYGPVYLVVESPSASSLEDISKATVIPIIPAISLTTNPDAQPDLLPAAKSFLATATTDRPDKLYTTLVTDERGTALGLVYSSEESVAESLRTGRGVYQSRKRGLWYKGETTGDVQELVNISLDCDQDCLRFVVRQKGLGKLELAEEYGL